MREGLDKIFSNIRVLRGGIIAQEHSSRIRFGGHKSLFRGSGFDFYHIREYDPARDPVSQIFWRYVGEPGKIYILEVIEPREQVVVILADLSSSMVFKKQLLLEMAGSIALTATHNQDRTAFIGFTDKIVISRGPKLGKANIHHVLREVYDFMTHPSVFLGKKTDFLIALDFLNKHYTKRSLVFILSDFVGWEDIAESRYLRMVSSRHEVICLILDDIESFNFEGSGTIPLRDVEEGSVTTVPTQEIENIKAETIRRRAEMIKKLARLGIGAKEFSCGDHLVKLAGFLEERRSK